MGQDSSVYEDCPEDEDDICPVCGCHFDSEFYWGCPQCDDGGEP